MSKLSDRWKREMPKPEEMAQRARNRYREEMGKEGIDPFERDYLKEHFDTVIDELLRLEHQLYLEKQKEVSVRVLAEEFPEPGGNKFWQEHYEELDRLFLTISQSRKQRAGGSFERHVDFLFERLKYPFDKQKTINGKPDFIMPNVETYKKNRSDAILFTAKRTLRERWHGGAQQ